MDVWHLRAPNTLIDPSHNIAKDALGVVLNLLRDIRVRQVTPVQYRNGQQIGQRATGPTLFDLVLTRQHVDFVVVHRVQCGGCGRWHPSAVRTRLGVTDLGLQHCLHQIRHGPHALADLGTSLQAAGQTDIDVAILIGADPGGVFHLALGHHRPCLHRGVNLVAGTIKEAGVDKGHARFGRADTLRQVDRGAALFIHDAQLDRIGRQTQHGFHAGKYLIGKGHFLGPVHLGLYHIDRSRDRVAHAPGLLQIVHRDQRGDHGIHQPFANLAPVTVQNGGVGHQVADIAHQHQRPPLDRQRAAVWRGIVAIPVHLARDLLAALLEGFRQIAFHQSQPVPIGHDLVLGVHGGNAVFTIHDRGHRGFQQHIRHACRIGLADVMRGVDPDFDVQPVVAQQDRLGRGGITTVADKLRPIFQRRCQCAVNHGIPRYIRVTARAKRGCVIQKRLGLRHNPCTTVRIVSLALRQITQSVGAVIGVIQAAPPRIGGVQGKAGVGDRHHQLRARHLSDFRVDAFRVNLERGAFGHQIPDLAQKACVGVRVMRLAGAFLVPAVDLGLHVFAGLQQRAVFGAKVMHQIAEPRPERSRIDAGAGQCCTLDKINQFGGNLKAVLVGTLCHLIAPVARVEFALRQDLEGIPSWSNMYW